MKPIKNNIMESAVKNAVQRMVKNISIIAIFASIGVVLLLYLGPEINIATSLVFRLAVPSVVLAMSNIMIYELWLTNGIRNGREEKDYIALLSIYAEKSDGIHYPTMQDFLDYERKRRYDVEHDRLTRVMEREQSILSKIQNAKEKSKLDNIRVWRLNKSIAGLNKARDTIRVKMPYEKSEEFDYLRYNIASTVYKEYKPSDTKRDLTRHRAKKYSFVITFTIVGLNLLSIGGAMGNVWVAIIMTVLATSSLIFAVVNGFSNGYNNISVISTGVYKTANSFIDQAGAFCNREHKDLYYKEPLKTKEIVETEVETEKEHVEEIKPEEVVTSDIFSQLNIQKK